MNTAIHMAGLVAICYFAWATCDSLSYRFPNLSLSVAALLGFLISFGGWLAITAAAHL